MAVGPPGQPKLRPESGEELRERFHTFVLQGIHRTGDTDNAARFAEEHGESFRHCDAGPRWWIYDGRRWAEDKTRAVDRAGKETFEGLRSMLHDAANVADKLADQLEQASDTKLKDEAKKYQGEAARCRKEADTLKRRRRLDDMKALACSEAPLPIRMEDFDRDPWLFNAPNGTVDLRTGELRPHRPEDYLSHRGGAQLDLRAACPRWEAFLRRIFDGDEGLIAFLRRAAGYSMTGDTREQCFFLLHGTGANGKSTFLEVLAHVFGSYSQAPDAQTFQTSRNDRHPTDLARLRGARFVRASEPGEQKALDEARIKRLTGGEPMTARVMYGDPFEFLPQLKLWLACNKRPTIRGTDEGIWRRIRLIPFEVQIPEAEQDKTLKDRLIAEEAPGILAWAVRGCLEWQKEEDLAPPEVVLAATGAYRAEENRLAGFLDECCETGEGFEAPMAGLFEAYRKWADDGNEPRPASKKTFGSLLRDSGYAPERAGDGSRIRRGLRLRHG